MEYFKDMFRKRTMEESEQFLGEIRIKQISNKEKEYLDAPLQLTELETALKRMSKIRALVQTDSL